MKLYKQIILLIFLVLCHFKAMAQITAQGQGGKIVLWKALGIEQKISERWLSKSAIAYSRHSDLSNYEVLKNAGVFTIRQEMVYRINNHFKFSQGLFYAKRYYNDEDHPAYLNEIRFYPRFYHEFKVGKVQFSHSVRVDFRFFSQPGFETWEKPFEFRNRYLIKASLPLGKSNKNALIFITEFFAATDKQISKDGNMAFSKYNFTENRTSIYFRHLLNKPNAYLDLGLMNQQWFDSDRIMRQSFLLQADIIFLNPFKRKG